MRSSISCLGARPGGKAYVLSETSSYYPQQILAIKKRGGSDLRRVFIALCFSLLLLPTLTTASIGLPCGASDGIAPRLSSNQHRNGLGIDWSIETVDNDTDVGIISEIVLDSCGTPIIIYQDQRHHRIKQAEMRDGHWNLDVIHGGAWLVESSLDIDARDRLYLAFDYGYYADYGIRENGTWQFDIIPVLPNGVLRSIAADPQGMPHGGTAGGPIVLHVYFDGDEWKSEEVEHRDMSFGFGDVSIEVDSQSMVHMVYTEYYNEFLTYALWDGYSWRREKVDDVYTPISLAVSSKGEPHILYYGPFACQCLRYASKIGNHWNIEDLPFAQASGSIAIDDKDRPHISFTTYKGILGYAFLNETSWKWTLVEGAENVEDTSLSLDSKGRPHISYYDAKNNNLMYARISEDKVLAEVDVDPDTLNLGSNGKWITAYIELGERYDVRDINAGTMLLNGVISPVLDPNYGFVKDEDSYIVDHDEDGLPERMVKFWRSEVQEILDAGLSVTITITGKLFDGTPFMGTDEIRVIDPDGLVKPKISDASHVTPLAVLPETHGFGNVPILVHFTSILDTDNDMQLWVSPQVAEPASSVVLSTNERPKFWYRA